MKKVLFILFISAVVTACGGNASSGNSDSTATTTASDNGAGSMPDASSPGAKLIAANDCSTCHKVDVKVIGPAFKDVAARYPATEANIDTLANKIIRGGKGNWGDVAMAPHPALPLNDAKTIVKYILSLKK